MKIKELKLDVEALMSQVVFGHGYLHYGYWESGTADEVSLMRLGQAQQHYFDLVAKTIPSGTRTILDVGSGTGSNALGLTRLGYALDCVCPSMRLNEIARRKLPPEVTVFESMFEDLKIDKTYDLVLFLESFHYIDAVAALTQARTLAKKQVLIFDYFPREDRGTADRITHQRFTSLIAGQFADTFRIVIDRDLTHAIVPTFTVLDEITNVHVRPFAARIIEEFRRDYPISSFLLAYPLRKILAKLQKQSRRQETFPAENEYRLILMDRI